MRAFPLAVREIRIPDPYNPELRARYTELKIDGRLERLDKTVAAYEKRIRDLTQQAEGYLAAYGYQKLVGVLEAAAKLQKHNTKILRIIERTEAQVERLLDRYRVPFASPIARQR